MEPSQACAAKTAAPVHFDPAAHHTLASYRGKRLVYHDWYGTMRVVLPKSSPAKPVRFAKLKQIGQAAKELLSFKAAAPQPPANPAVYATTIILRGDVLRL